LENLENSSPEINSNLNDLTNNNVFTQNTPSNQDFNNMQKDNNINKSNNEINLEISEEDYFSAEENDFECISDQKWKIFE